ncbi:MAG: hypothetical protein K0S26_1776 [Bacteroidota bacterium]|nr:hypothetical protein [Bacteroidota bacterium]
MAKNLKFKIFAYGILFVLSVTPVFIKKAVSESSKTKNELFKPELIRFDNSQKLIYGIDSIYMMRLTSDIFDTALYVQTASDFVKNRFYHGLATYSITDNWIAYLAGKLFWPHFSAIVKPDDLLKHGDGLCSQQTIVLLDVLRKKGITFRTVGLGYKEGPGHFLSEIKYDGKWHLHDVTKEPEWNKIVNHHLSLDYYLMNKDSLYVAYEGKLSRPVFNKILEKVEYGKVNEFPAKNMLLFHNGTLFLMYVLPLIFLFLFVLSFSKERSIKNGYKNSSEN